MTREEYKKNLKDELEGMDAGELREYARKNYVRLYTRIPSKMVDVIVEAMTNREFHGDAFRDERRKIHG